MLAQALDVVYLSVKDVKQNWIQLAEVGEATSAALDDLGFDDVFLDLLGALLDILGQYKSHQSSADHHQELKSQSQSILLPWIEHDSGKRFSEKRIELLIDVEEVEVPCVG